MAILISMRLWLVIVLALGCGRVAFETHDAPSDDAAVCALGATCIPAVQCWTGTCDPAGVCEPTAPISGTCSAGTCGSDGVCQGAVSFALPIASNPYDLFGMGVDWQGDRMVAGAPGPGIANVLERSPTGTWSVAATLMSSIGGPNTDFGLAVAVDGDRAVVGSHSYNVGHGAAEVFERQPNGTWSSVGPLANPGTAIDFASTLDLQGDRAIVGGESSGTAYIFDRDGTGTWNLSATLGPYIGGFGKNVILDGDRAFVSATWDANTDGKECGSVRVFERDTSGAWLQVAYLQPPVAEKVDGFGIGMAVDGDVLAVGGEWASKTVATAGVVIVFRRDASGIWQLEAALHETSELVDGELGRGVAIHGDRIVATMVRPTDGLLAVFRRQPDGHWLEVGRLIDPMGSLAGYGTGGISSDLQIRMIGDRAMVGAPFRSATATRDGQIVSYDLTGL